MNIYRCTFLKALKINAIVLYPFILFAEDRPDQEIIRHESVHVDQIKKWGIIRFYTRYLLEYYQLRRRGLSHFEAYRNISFEKEAYGDGDKT